MNRLLLSSLLCLPATVTFAVDFQKDIVPIFKAHCYKCHSEAEKKEKGKLVLDNLTRLGEKLDGKVIAAGDPEKSAMYKDLLLDKDDDDHMPPAKEAQLKDPEIAAIKQWIAEGAKFVGGGAAPAVAVAPASVPPAVPPAAAPPAAAPPAAAPEPTPAGALETWTNTAGKSLKATKLRLEGDSVVLQLENGVCYSVPLASLSPESQAQAKK